MIHQLKRFSQTITEIRVKYFQNIQNYLIKVNTIDFNPYFTCHNPGYGKDDLRNEKVINQVFK